MKEGYIFHCSKCKFSHAGECRSPYDYKTIVEKLSLEGWKVETYKDSSITLTKTIRMKQPLTFIPIEFNIYRTTKEDQGFTA